MLKLNTDIGVVCLGCASILLASCYTFPPFYGFWGRGFGFFLELMGTVVLCFGVVKQNPFYLLPWLLINGVFTCIFMFPVTFIIKNREYVDVKVFLLAFAIILMAFSAVIQAFCRMRKDRATSSSNSAA